MYHLTHSIARESLKNSGILRAIFSKRPHIRACPYLYRRGGHTAHRGKIQSSRKLKVKDLSDLPLVRLIGEKCNNGWTSVTFVNISSENLLQNIELNN